MLLLWAAALCDSAGEFRNQNHVDALPLGSGADIDVGPALISVTGRPYPPLAEINRKYIVKTTGNISGLTLAYAIDNVKDLSTPTPIESGVSVITIPAEAYKNHYTPGRHTIYFELLNGKTEVDLAECVYRVNNVPKISLDYNWPAAQPGLGVALQLPIKVEDDDGLDNVLVLYRFNVLDHWSALSAIDGRWYIPASSLKPWLTPGAHAIQLVATDEVDTSDPIEVDYSINPATTAAENAAAAGVVADDGPDLSSSGASSGWIIAGLGLAAFALIALAITLYVVIQAKRKESSSPGLIESE